MRNTDEKITKATQIYYDFFQTTFETIDVTSGFWQPYLKAVGRTQMELAGLQARQAQALVQWTHQVMHPVTPFDVLNANIQFWQTMTEQCTEVVPRVAAAIETAAQSAVAPFPVKRSASKVRDRLILLDREAPDRDSAATRLRDIAA